QNSLLAFDSHLIWESQTLGEEKLININIEDKLKEMLPFSGNAVLVPSHVIDFIKGNERIEYRLKGSFVAYPYITDEKQIITVRPQWHGYRTTLSFEHWPYLGVIFKITNERNQPLKNIISQIKGDDWKETISIGLISQGFSLDEEIPFVEKQPLCIYVREDKDWIKLSENIHIPQRLYAIPYDPLGRYFAKRAFSGELGITKLWEDSGYFGIPQGYLVFSSIIGLARDTDLIEVYPGKIVYKVTKEEMEVSKLTTITYDFRRNLTIEDRVYRKRAKKWWYPKEFYPLRFYFQNEIPLLTTVIEDGKEYLYSVCSAKVQIIEKPGDSKAGFRLLTIGEIRASAKEEQWKKWLDGNRYTLIENGKRILTKENRFEVSTLPYSKMWSAKDAFRRNSLPGQAKRRIKPDSYEKAMKEVEEKGLVLPIALSDKNFIEEDKFPPYEGKLGDSNRHAAWVIAKHLGALWIAFILINILLGPGVFLIAKLIGAFRKKRPYVNDGREQTYMDLDFSKSETENIQHELIENGPFTDPEDVEERLNKLIIKNPPYAESLKWFTRWRRNRRVRKAIERLKAGIYELPEDIGFSQGDFNSLSGAPSEEKLLNELGKLFTFNEKQKEMWNGVKGMLLNFFELKELKQIIGLESSKILINRVTKDRAAKIILRNIWEELLKKDEYRKEVERGVNKLFIRLKIKDYFPLRGHFPDQFKILRSGFLDNIFNIKALPGELSLPEEGDIAVVRGTTGLYVFSGVDDLPEGLAPERLTSTIHSLDKFLIYQIVLGRGLTALTGQGRFEDYLFEDKLKDMLVSEPQNIIPTVFALRNLFMKLLYKEVQERWESVRDPKGGIIAFQRVLLEEEFNDISRFLLGKSEPGLKNDKYKWVLSPKTLEKTRHFREELNNLLEEFLKAYNQEDTDKERLIDITGKKFKHLAFSLIHTVE
ncbi:MAG: hypothetical protein DRP76_04580, partial [Candidatus Omnitrophota bacterium]